MVRDRRLQAKIGGESPHPPSRVTHSHFRAQLISPQGAYRAAWGAVGGCMKISGLELNRRVDCGCGLVFPGCKFLHQPCQWGTRWELKRLDNRNCAALKVPFNTGHISIQC